MADDRLNARVNKQDLIELARKEAETFVQRKVKVAGKSLTTDVSLEPLTVSDDRGLSSGNTTYDGSTARTIYSPGQSLESSSNPSFNSVSIASSAKVGGVELSRAGHAHVLSDVTDVTVSATEVNRLSGTTSNVQTQLNSKVDRSLLGVAGGVATLDSEGTVPAAQLPSYVDDVLEYDSADQFPTTGESSKIYVSKDENLTYRWTGTQYTEISKSLALGETASTAYRGDRGKIAYEHSLVTSGNPHHVTKAEVGLGSVDNTADRDKNVLTATRLATPVTIGISGAVTGTATSLDGSTNITIPTTRVDATTIQGSATLTGLVLTGGASTQTILPSTTDTYDLGSTEKEFRTLYAGSSILSGSLSVAGGITGTLTGNATSADKVNETATFTTTGFNSAPDKTYDGSVARTIYVPDQNVNSGADVTFGTVTGTLEGNATSADKTNHALSITTAGKGATGTFDGSSAVSIYTPNQNVNSGSNVTFGTVTASLKGNAASADKTNHALSTVRTVTSVGTFDGSSNLGVYSPGQLLESSASPTFVRVTASLTGSVEGNATSADKVNHSISFTTEGNNKPESTTSSQVGSYDGSSALSVYVPDQNVNSGADVTFGTVTASLEGNAHTASRVINSLTISKTGPTSSTTYDGSAVATVYTPDQNVNSGSNVVFGTITGSLTGSISGNASTADRVNHALSFVTTGSNTAVEGAVSSFDGSTARSIYVPDQNVNSGSSPTFTAVTAQTVTASLKGNATTATTLQTARKINGTNFSGSADITTSRWGAARNLQIADSEEANTGTVTSIDGSSSAVLHLPSNIEASLTGNATSADKTNHALTVTTTGSGTGGTFDGSTSATVYTPDQNVNSGSNVTFGTVTASSYTGTWAGAVLDSARIPTASTSVKGGVRLGTGLSIASEAISVIYGTTSTTAYRGDLGSSLDARTTHISYDSTTDSTTIDGALNLGGSVVFTSTPRVGSAQVSLEGHTHVLADLTDVTATASEVGVLHGITATTAELNILDGVTATAAEISRLHGITATTTELNYTHGVTSGIQTQLDSKVSSSLLGKAGGVATLDSSGTVPASQLPSYVDDVLEYDSLSDLPSKGESSKIYVVLDTNLTYRWTGSGYVEISKSLALGETASTAYRGDRGKTAYEHSQVVTGNPHHVTKTEVGLGSLTNDRQVKGLSTGTTEGHVVSWGADGYTVKDSGYTLGMSVPAGSRLTDTNYYPTKFTWTSGTSAGPTGSLTGTGMSAVSIPTIPSASKTSSGIVTTVAQTLSGVKTFDSNAVFSTGITLNNTATDGSELILRREANPRESAKISVDDGYLNIDISQDEATSHCRFTFNNSDIESGGGANANTSTVVLYGDKRGSHIQATTFEGYLAGNAYTTTKLATARKIAGVSFNGSADISIPFANLTNRPTSADGYGITDVVKTTGAQTITGAKTFSETIRGSISGNSATATKLATARNIAGISFDGSADISIPFANLISRPTTVDGYGITDAIKTTGNQTIGGSLKVTGTLTATATRAESDSSGNLITSYATTLDHTSGTTVGETLTLKSRVGATLSSFALDIATASRSGVVSTGEQNFSGKKTFISDVVLSKGRLYLGSDSKAYLSRNQYTGGIDIIA